MYSIRLDTQDKQTISLTFGASYILTNRKLRWEYSSVRLAKPRKETGLRIFFGKKKKAEVLFVFKGGRRAFPDKGIWEGGTFLSLQEIEKILRGRQCQRRRAWVRIYVEKEIVDGSQ